MALLHPKGLDSPEQIPPTNCIFRLKKPEITVVFFVPFFYYILY
jgi:hypothetical protein